MKILTVVGARPQFIKAAALSRAVAAYNGRGVGPAIEEVLVHTGQHYDDGLSAVFFRELAIPEPAYHLAIGSASHGRQTGRMLEAVEEVLCAEKPDLALVYGDTNSTLAGALAAVKMHIPAVHVEAGLRSRNRRMPEEINRVLTDHAVDLLLTPTHAATANLLEEGIPRERIYHVGDVMYDAALHYGSLEAQGASLIETLGLPQGGYVLATVHRAENTDDASVLRNIMTALGSVARDRPVVMPLHPRTGRRLQEFGIALPRGIEIVAPLGYVEMAHLEKNAFCILTDSGGVQKEACFHGVPCVTLRDETEWVETVAAGWNQVVGTDPERICRAVATCTGGKPIEEYGDGRAAERIVEILAGRFQPGLP